MHVEQLKPIPMSVFLFSGEEIIVPIESYTTVRELKAAVMSKIDFNVSRSLNYGLYEVCARSKVVEERFLEEHEKVVDVLCLWAKDLDEALKTRESMEFRVYLRMMLFYESQDQDTANFLYHQNAYDFIHNKFDFGPDKAVPFSAFKLFIGFPDNEDEAYKALESGLEDFVPSLVATAMDKEEWIQRLMEIYFEIKSGSVEESKRLFVEKLAGSPFYQGNQFQLKFSSKNQQADSEDFPDEVLAVFRPRELAFYSLDKEPLKSFKYNTIANWGISATFFVIVVPKRNDVPLKLYFESKQTKVIQHILESYANILAGKNLTDVENINKESEKRFGGLPSGRERSTTSYTRYKDDTF